MEFQKMSENNNYRDPLEVMEEFKRKKPLPSYLQLVKDLKELGHNPDEYYVDAHYKMYLHFQSSSKKLQSYMYLSEACREISAIRSRRKKSSRETKKQFDLIIQEFKNLHNTHFGSQNL